MRVVYVSPSVLPSRSANSIHVLRQCNALAGLGVDVLLIASSPQKDVTTDTLVDFYGFEIDKRVQLKALHFNQPKALNLRIALSAFAAIVGLKRPPIISRNLYFSFLYSLAGLSHIYETHLVENGFRARLQRFILRRWKTNVVISDALAAILSETHGVPPDHFIVLHDAASEAERVDVSDLIATHTWPRPKIGYFGHLYEGRGVEIVLDLAKDRPDCDFYVVGGEPDLVEHFRGNDAPGNMHFLGFQSNSVARAMMTQMDILLMPYQKKVSIGVAGSDTSRWMSPLKMFEYMSSNVAIVSSDLPVLREVLEHNDTALLVEPDDKQAWRDALARLLDDSALRLSLSRNARRLFEEKYTWEKRAQSLLNGLKRH